MGPSVGGVLQAPVCVSSMCRSEKQCTCFGKQHTVSDGKCIVKTETLKSPRGLCPAVSYEGGLH